MSNHQYNYRDSNFSPHQAANLTLLIQVSQTTFSYAIIDENELLVWEENRDLGELKHLKNDGSELSANYKQVIIGLPDLGFTLVPVSLFMPDKIAEFARFLDVKPHEKVFSQPLNKENQVIFKVNEDIFNGLTANFDVKNMFFASKGWINATGNNNPSRRSIYLNIENDRVEFLNYKNGKLRFYNSFKFQTEDELCYFATLVATELQLPPQNTTIILSGDTDRDDQYFTRLGEFFEKVELNPILTIELPAQLLPHKLLMLTALALCGSLAAH